MEAPTETQYAQIECAACGGHGCGACGESGYDRITSCPCRDLPGDLAEVLRLARLFRRGLPPVAGGALEQTQWFLRAADFIWSEEARIRRELRLNTPGDD